MTVQEADEELAHRRELWAVREFHKQLDDNFALLRRVPDDFNCAVVNILDNLSKSEQVVFGEAVLAYISQMGMHPFVPVKPPTANLTVAQNTILAAALAEFAHLQKSHRFWFEVCDAESANCSKPNRRKWNSALLDIFRPIFGRNIMRLGDDWTLTGSRHNWEIMCSISVDHDSFSFDFWYWRADEYRQGKERDAVAHLHMFDYLSQAAIGRSLWIMK